MRAPAIEDGEELWLFFIQQVADAISTTKLWRIL